MPTNTPTASPLESARLSFYKYPINPGPEAIGEVDGPPLQRDPRTMPMAGDAQFVLILDEYGEWLETLD